ncbi:hypothetical protein RJT34_17718 [Clitoria ternatea]|uniref:Non-specific lipid-transfer protein n=1 Tax=Clitoria ternatea TaxID=43366 RepID=A0AAN9JAS4_CLITE
MGSVKKLACVVVACMVMLGGAPKMAQGITCGQVTGNLAPCLFYLLQGGSVSRVCCNGVRNVLGGATTTSDRQTVCSCLKTAAHNFGITGEYAHSLPSLCKVNVPYKISASTNCTSQIKDLAASGNSEGSRKVSQFYHRIRQRIRIRDSECVCDEVSIYRAKFLY